MFRGLEVNTMLLLFGSVIIFGVLAFMHQAGVAYLYGVARRDEGPAFFNLALFTDGFLMLAIVLGFQVHLEPAAHDYQWIGDLLVRIFALVYGVFSWQYSVEAANTGVVRSQYGELDRNNPWFGFNCFCYGACGVGFTLFGLGAIIAFLMGHRFPF